MPTDPKGRDHLAMHAMSSFVDMNDLRGRVALMQEEGSLELLSAIKAEGREQG